MVLLIIWQVTTTKNLFTLAPNILANANYSNNHQDYEHGHFIGPLLNTNDIYKEVQHIEENDIY